jgi:hypothetical protein
VPALTSPAGKPFFKPVLGHNAVFTADLIPNPLLSHYFEKNLEPNLQPSRKIGIIWQTQSFA